MPAAIRQLLNKPSGKSIFPLSQSFAARRRVVFQFDGEQIAPVNAGSRPSIFLTDWL
ncbi:hypothetical protein HHJ44_19995 [Escherichia coli]|nr:hypothetical protein HHJ44_19995 [Escherichia coli]